ncbi:MAG: SpoIID/LytB domain-containing protein, partial [bacterium]
TVAPAIAPPLPVAAVPIPSENTPETRSSESLPLFDATILIKSSPNIVARGGEVVSYTLGVKNSGSAVWPDYALRSNAVQIATSSAEPVSFAASNWPAATLAVSSGAASVAPGNLVLIPFNLQMPKTKGVYAASFQLIVAGQEMEGAALEIPVTVTDDAYTPPPVIVPVQSPAYLAPEPIIRIGLTKTSGETITADQPFSVQDEAGNTLLNLPANAQVSLSYASGVYRVASSLGNVVTSDLPIRVVPSVYDGVLTVVSYTNRPAGNSALNDNEFRNILELHYSVANDTVWLINELPIESYLKGLVEVSDRSPLEYRKALQSAARSYAYYHWTKKFKHKDRNFDLDARYDQVYRGYGAEKRQPGISLAVEATRGMVVTYQGNPAVTPYYAYSDGRTRSWEEVWGGVVPYLVSVPAPYDVGGPMSGHGVGISAMDAAGHAKNEGWDYLRILNYYYTGVNVEKRW